MNRQTTLCFGLIFSLLAACSLKPGTGVRREGSDVVQPLWADHSPETPLPDTLRCANMVALLIGIGQYDPANGWESLSTKNDVDLMEKTLLKRGLKPANIHKITDQQATKRGIENALKTLTDTLQPGRQLLILYAGHARQLPDNNADETDGYDEAIVPYDAPPANQTQPNGYLRDDELNRYLTRIRAALGPRGSLWLIFDSCHSQTLNRGQIVQRTRGGVAPMGSPTQNRPQQARNEPLGSSDWYENLTISTDLAPYALFAATTDGGPNFETTDASGRSFGPLTRAIGETWNSRIVGETYRSLFARVAVAMARYAPYQKPGLDGDADMPAPGCGSANPIALSGYRTTAGRLRIAWPHRDEMLTKLLADLPFVQMAGAHPDLRIDRQNRGYRLVPAANNGTLSGEELSAEGCVERIRQYFARNVLLQLHQTNPDFQIQTTMQRVAVQTEGTRTVVTDTLPNLTTTGLPTFRAVPNERVVLTLTNTGPKPFYLTVVDLQPDGGLHVLLPGTGQSPAECRLLPGQSLRQRVRMTEPFGAEVYKLLLTPDPIDLRAVLQTRGQLPTRHPYETLFQRTYATRGMSEIPVQLSEKSGGAGEVAFWVRD
jgi:hypothetical protein